MSWRPCLLVSDRPEIAGLRTSLASFQWFAATLPTALIPTPLTLQKNANKPLRRTLLPKLLARFVRKGVHRPTNRCVTALHSTFPCSLFSSMFSLIGEGDSEVSGRRWGYFQLCSFSTPIRTPISVTLTGERGRVPTRGCDELGTAGEGSERRIKLGFQSLGPAECDSRIQNHTRRLFY